MKSIDISNRKFTVLVCNHDFCSCTLQHFELYCQMTFSLYMHWMDRMFLERHCDSLRGTGVRGMKFMGKHRGCNTDSRIRILKTNVNLMHFVCGWGTALQSGRSRGCFPMVPLEVFMQIIPPAMGSTQPLTEMSTGNISWGVKSAGA